MLACLLFFAMPISVSAKIATPTFQQLVRRSSQIISGRVLAVIPTPFSPTAELALVLLMIIVILRKRRSARRVLLACGIAALGIVLGLAVRLLTYDRVYENVAFVQVQRSFAGETGAVVPVFLRTSFVCDMSELSVGRSYFMFLDRSMIGYQPSWYDKSFWQINRGAVNTRRMRAARSPLPYESFVEGIIAVQQGQSVAFLSENEERPNSR